MNATLVTGSPVTHFMLSYTSTLVTTSAILFSDTVKYVEHTAICWFSDNLSLGEKEFLKKKRLPHATQPLQVHTSFCEVMGTDSLLHMADELVLQVWSVDTLKEICQSQRECVMSYGQPVCLCACTIIAQYDPGDTSYLSEYFPNNILGTII